MPSVKYYDILEISPDASADAIRAAHRRLSRKYHPDTNPDAEGVQHFKLIQEARAVLCDSVKRAQYDEQLTRSVGSRATQDLHGVKYHSGAQFGTGYAVPEAARPSGSECADDETQRAKQSVNSIWKGKTAIGIVAFCFLVVATVLLDRTSQTAKRVPASTGLESRSLLTGRPGGAVTRGNIAAWTEPARPRFDQDYRVMLAVYLPAGSNPLRVSDLVDGHIARDDGFRQQIPYHASAPNASWITADQNRERITSSFHTVSVVAGRVQFAFEVPATDHRTIETIQVRSNVSRSSDYWELVVNRSR